MGLLSSRLAIERKKFDVSVPFTAKTTNRPIWTTRTCSCWWYWLCWLCWLCWLSYAMAISLWLGYHGFCLVVRWKANAGLLLPYSTITPVSHITINCTYNNTHPLITTYPHTNMTDVRTGTHKDNLQVSEDVSEAPIVSVLREINQVSLRQPKPAQDQDSRGWWFKGLFLYYIKVVSFLLWSGPSVSQSDS